MVHCPIIIIIIIIINLLFYVLRYYKPPNTKVFKYIHKAYGVIGNWPKEKGTIVMLSFPSKKEASDWVILPEVKEAKWFSGSDIIITSVKEQYQSGWLFFFIFDHKELKKTKLLYQKWNLPFNFFSTSWSIDG